MPNNQTAAELEAVVRWRWQWRSTIRNTLGLARTSYLNANACDKRRVCQRILLDIQATRPLLTGPVARAAMIGDEG